MEMGIVPLVYWGVRPDMLIESLRLMLLLLAPLLVVMSPTCLESFPEPCCSADVRFD